jgi:hypothetical protein
MFYSEPFMRPSSYEREVGALVTIYKAMWCFSHPITDMKMIQVGGPEKED